MMWQIILGWLAAQVLRDLLAKLGLRVDLDLLPPLQSTWRWLPGLPRWVVNETDDKMDQRIYPRVIRQVGIEWEPLALRLVICWAYEVRAGSGQLRTPRSKPTPRRTVEVTT